MMTAVIMVVAPLAAALVVSLLPGSWRRWCAPVAVLGSLGSLAAAGIMMGPVISGQALEFRLPGLILPGGPGFRVDGLSLILATTSALIWLAALLASVDYMRPDNRARRYYVCLLLTLTGVLGTFLAADFLTLILFFEMMTLASYFLVVHAGSRQSIRAGTLYLLLSLAGGLILVLGAAVLHHSIGTVSLSARLSTASYLAPTLLSIGFAVKAGLVPLHVWLPEAHPVAPAPASAVLSGIMIKTGAYGILRSLLLLEPGAIAQNLGLLLMLLAGVSMLAGVGMALLQSNAKRMLAYHSVSQMGYVLMGVGAAAYLGAGDPLGFAGGIYHMVNHALFKSALFLAVGAVYIRTGELDMYRLGGLWRHMPLTTFLALIAALGIAGVPGLNGYASKTVLHHALHHAAYSAPVLSLVEWAFVITGAGTVCSFIKFMSFVFFGRPRSHYRGEPGEGLPTLAGLGILALFIILLGARPGTFLASVIAPSYAYVSTAAVPASLNLFTPADLLGIGTCLGLGAVMFWAGLRFGLFHLHPPAWLSVGWLASSLSQGGQSLVTRAALTGSLVAGHVESRLVRLNRSLGSALRSVDAPSLSPYVRYQMSVSNLTFDAAVVVGVLALILVSRVVIALVP